MMRKIHDNVKIRRRIRNIFIYRIFTSEPAACEIYVNSRNYTAFFIFG